MSINNVVSESNMAQSESEPVTNWRQREMELEIAMLYKRLDRLECKWDALIRRLEGVARHPEDEGWFD